MRSKVSAWIKHHYPKSFELIVVSLSQGQREEWTVSYSGRTSYKIGLQPVFRRFSSRGNSHFIYINRFLWIYRMIYLFRSGILCLRRRTYAFSRFIFDVLPVLMNLCRGNKCIQCGKKARYACSVCEPGYQLASSQSVMTPFVLINCTVYRLCGEMRARNPICPIWWWSRTRIPPGWWHVFFL